MVVERTQGRAIKDRAEVLDRLSQRHRAAGQPRRHQDRPGDRQRPWTNITEAVAAYLKDMEPPQCEPKTYNAYKYCLELFAKHPSVSCKT